MLGVIQRDEPGGGAETGGPAGGLLCAAVEIVIIPSAGVGFVPGHAIEMEIDRLADPGIVVGGRLHCQGLDDIGVGPDIVEQFGIAAADVGMAQEEFDAAIVGFMFTRFTKGHDA